MPSGNATPSATWRAPPAPGWRERRSAGPELLTGRQVKLNVVRVGVPAAVDDDLVPVMLGQAAEIDVGHKRPRWAPCESALARS